MCVTVFGAFCVCLFVCGNFCVVHFVIHYVVHTVCCGEEDEAACEESRQGWQWEHCPLIGSQLHLLHWTGGPRWDHLDLEKLDFKKSRNVYKMEIFPLAHSSICYTGLWCLSWTTWIWKSLTSRNLENSRKWKFFFWLTIPFVTLVCGASVEPPGSGKAWLVKI